MIKMKYDPILGVQYTFNDIVPSPDNIPTPTRIKAQQSSNIYHCIRVKQLFHKRTKQK